MGQMFFSSPGDKAPLQLDTRKAPVRDTHEQQGYNFSITDGCMLKMIAPFQSKAQPNDVSNKLTVSKPENIEQDTPSKCIVAAFDMDQTLVTTKSGLKFGRNGYDWKFLPNVPVYLRHKLRDLKKENPHHRIIVVIFTNQNGCLPIFSGKSLQYLRTKLIGVCNALPLFDYAFAALKAPTPELKAQYRKPGHGMFVKLGEELQERYGASIDLEKSFYVGDAAGRPGDHSADDQGFAENAKLRFYVPEDYFK